MTQMGLDYMKYTEAGRHNLADEEIRRHSNVISQQDANTRARQVSYIPQELGIKQQEADAKSYEASFAPIKAQATAKQAEASASQAETAKGRLDLDKAYRGIETAIKQQEAQAKSDTAAAKKYETVKDDLSFIQQQLQVGKLAGLSNSQIASNIAARIGEQGFRNLLEQVPTAKDVLNALGLVTKLK